MKKIVHISFSDKVGGAAIGAYRLHRLMLYNGIDSKMLVFENLRKEPSISKVYSYGLDSIFKKIKVYIFGIKSFSSYKNFGYFSSFNLGRNIRNNKLILEADIIYLHWVNYGLINTNDIIYLLKNNKKVIWMMHDMFPITGGCHYSFTCKEYEKKCDNCHFLNKKRLAIKQFKKKALLKKYKNMYWVAPSLWLYKNAEKSNVVEKSRLSFIPNALSPKFFPIDKEFSKKALGLSVDYHYILYGANNVVNSPYKGFSSFLKVIDELSKIIEDKNIQNIKLILFGTSENEELNHKIHFPALYMGDVTDEYAMNLLYNASDLLLMTSVADNAPLVIQECKSGGTPVVAFDVGGIPEMINNEKEGFVIENNNFIEMSMKIIKIISNEFVFSKEIPDFAFNEKVFNEHIKLFE